MPRAINKLNAPKVRTCAPVKYSYGGGTTPLAQNTFGAGELDDVMRRQEVWRIP